MSRKGSRRRRRLPGRDPGRPRARSAGRQRCEGALDRRFEPDRLPVLVLEGLSDASQIDAAVGEVDAAHEVGVLHGPLSAHTPLEDTFDVDDAGHPRQHRLKRHAIEVGLAFELASFRQFGDWVLPVPEKRHPGRDLRRATVPPLHVDAELTDAVLEATGDAVRRRRTRLGLLHREVRARRWHRRSSSRRFR